MVSRPDSWMPIYIGDYLADTMHLTTQEHGAYLLLIFAYWRTGRALSNQDIYLSRVTRLSLKKWIGMKPKLLPFFRQGDGILYHNRIEQELESARKEYDRQKARTAAASAARWVRNDIRNGEIDESVTECVTDTVTDSVTLSQPQPQPQPQREDKNPSPRKVRGAGVHSKPTAPRRGSRLAPDWKPDLDLQAYASKLGLDPDDVTERFRNYWIAKAGRDATKLDWPATWRTWCMNAVERGQSLKPNGVNGRGPGQEQFTINPKTGRPYTSDEYRAWLEEEPF